MTAHKPFRHPFLPSARPPSWGCVAVIAGLFLASLSCSRVFHYPESQSETGDRCHDGTDNDFNGLSDCDDPSCDGSCLEASESACSDGRDNDGDGLVDGPDPGCWPWIAPEAKRCASHSPTSFEERFDAPLSAARWFPFGGVTTDGAPIAELQAPGDRDQRQDRVLGFGARGPNGVVGGISSTPAFDGDWGTLSLRFSARLAAGGFARVALVPTLVARAGEVPITGADADSVMLELDGRGEAPELVLRRGSATSAAPLGADTWHDVELAADGEQLVVLVDGEEALRSVRGSLAASRIVITGEARLTAGGKGAAQLDDLRLSLRGTQPCSAEVPQIPFGGSCRLDPPKLEEDVGFSVSVAGQGRKCAVVAGGPTGVSAATGVSSWYSDDGDTWMQGSLVDAGSQGSVTGAGVAWDAASQTFRAVVGERETGGVRLVVSSSADCEAWDEVQPALLAPSDAEAPSWVIPGVAAPYELYFTRAAGAGVQRSLWRARSSDGHAFTLDAAALAEFPAFDGVHAPVSIQRLTSADIVATYPIAPDLGVLGIGVLVAADHTLGQWAPVASQPLLQVGDGTEGFDSRAIVSGALSWGGESGFLLYGARGRPFELGSATDLLTVGSARLTLPGAVPDESVEATPYCGDGQCGVDETCASCEADCGACEGEVLHADSFESLDGWQSVAPGLGSTPATIYVSSGGRLSLEPRGAGWILYPLAPSVAHDFELSFDVHVVAPSTSDEHCTAYVGVGAAPQPAAMSPAGVFARLDQQLDCTAGAPGFSTLVRAGHDELRSLPSMQESTCTGALAGVAEQWHRVRLRRENNVVTLRVDVPEGCELTSDGSTRIEHVGALPALNRLLIGWGAQWDGAGWLQPCAGSSGAVTIDNVVLRNLPCGEGATTCVEPNTGETVCADVSTSPEHCGGCFQRVGEAEVCVNGSAVCEGTVCKDPSSGKDLCVSLTSGSVMCGSCGTMLTEHEECFEGRRVAKMVAVPAGFLIDSTEVTRDQYADWLATKPDVTKQRRKCPEWNASFTPSCTWPPPATTGDHAASCVDWCDADTYCQAQDKHLCARIMGGPVPYASANEETLDQWYYVCSQNGAHLLPYGDTSDPNACWTRDNPELQCVDDSNVCASTAVASLPTCQTPPGDFAGVFDLIGEVTEWEDSCSPADGRYKSSCRVRGASFYNTASHTDSKCAGADFGSLTVASRHVGIRCCRF